MAHYVAADGCHGVVISETDDVEANYRNILNYGQWVEYDTDVMLTVEQAVPHIMDALAAEGASVS
jgi:predicted transport protein